MENIKEKYLELAKGRDYEVCIWGAGFLGTGKGLQLLYKRDILVDYYCDNNSALWGKEIVNGIKCISPMELEKRKAKVICFLFVASTVTDDVLNQIKEMQIERVVLFDELFDEEKKVYFPFMKKKRTAFYTCIVGDYDDLREPLFVSPECDYYLISDKKPNQNSIFQYIDIRQYLPKHIIDNTRKNRYCKINAHKIFPQYNYSIYFDGQIQVNGSITKFIEELPKTRIMTLCRHHWKCLYMEAMRVILNKRDSEDIVTRQIEKYWLEGMPENFGSVYCGILIREHNNPICKKLMEDWWEEVEQYSKRDMISFPYVLWKNGYTIDDVKTVADNYKSEYWKAIEQHKRMEDRGVR